MRLDLTKPEHRAITPSFLVKGDTVYVFDAPWREGDYFGSPSVVNLRSRRVGRGTALDDLVPAVVYRLDRLGGNATLIVDDEAEALREAMRHAATHVEPLAARLAEVAPRTEQTRLPGTPVIVDRHGGPVPAVVIKHVGDTTAVAYCEDEADGADITSDIYYVPTAWLSLDRDAALALYRDLATKLVATLE